MEQIKHKGMSKKISTHKLEAVKFDEEVMKTKLIKGL
jgi:hypothetical protein